MARMSNERMQLIMAECDKYQIRLANDPTVLGPKYLQDMIATCRDHTNHVVLLLGEVRRAKMEIDFELRRKETAFKIAADELLAKNPIVRTLPNIKDRESQINIILKDEHREVVNLQNDLLDLEHIEDFVKVRHRELKDSMKEIYTQRGLLRDEHETGAMYGNERPTSMGVSAEDMQSAFTPGAHAKPEGIDEDDIERMLQANGVEVVEEPAAKPVEPPVEPKAEVKPVVPNTSAPKNDEETIRGFLDAEPSAIVVPSIPLDPTPVMSSTSDDDFTDLLNNI